MSDHGLPHPARYFPISTGRYELGPGLRSLSQDFGNGAADARLFQLDSGFRSYRENKLACRHESLSKYYAQANYGAEVSSAVNRLIVVRLCEEHPHYFHWREAHDGGELTCRLTGEVLRLDPSFELSAVSGDVAYTSAFDALCSQVHEDIAVMQLSSDNHGSKTDWLAAIHLCSPSHWAAEEKIGRSFIEIHDPVPGIEKVNRASRSLLEAMVQKGPYVRFVWGFATDTRLNHHPVPPPGFDPVAWRGRSFDSFREAGRADGSPFILRVERQVLWGLPKVDAGLFAIHVYFVDGNEIRRNPIERDLLRSVLLSMSVESRSYKGLTESMDAIVGWLGR